MARNSWHLIPDESDMRRSTAHPMPDRPWPARPTDLSMVSEDRAPTSFAAAGPQPATSRRPGPCGVGNRWSSAGTNGHSRYARTAGHRALTASNPSASALHQGQSAVRGGRPRAFRTAMGGLCAIQHLRYSPGHGITIAASAPMARVHPAQQPRGPGGSLLRNTFRPSYVCPTCGALVATSAHERHVDWHVKIGG